MTGLGQTRRVLVMHRSSLSTKETDDGRRSYHTSTRGQGRDLMPYRLSMSAAGRDRPCLCPLRRRSSCHDRRLTTDVDRYHATLAGKCAFRNLRTRLMVRAFSSGGSFQGYTVTSAFSASEAMSTQVC